MPKKQYFTVYEVGYRFGERTVIGPREFKEASRKIWGYLCRCSCGNVDWVQENSIRRGSQGRCLSCANRAKNTGEQAKRPGWRGGRSLTGSGYIRLTTPDGRSIYEHRLVMEHHLARELRPNETVHHKNGIRTDNRIENLELWSNAQPYGQRVEDKIKWAIEFLSSYYPEALKV